MIDDRAHAFGNRLVLHMDVADSGIDRVVALCLAVDPVVVVLVGGRSRRLGSRAADRVIMESQ